MIQDSKFLADLQRDWAGIDKLQLKLRGDSWILPNGTLFQMDYPPEAKNTPFLLSYVVLEKVLLGFKSQGTFICYKKETLKNLMEASKLRIPWENFETVDSGRLARNALAHEAVLLSKKDCNYFIGAIRIELVGWSII